MDRIAMGRMNNISEKKQRLDMVLFLASTVNVVRVLKYRKPSAFSFFLFFIYFSLFCSLIILRH